MTHQLRLLLLALSCCAAFTACPKPRALCGNGRVETGEVCDDGNMTSGDGCEADCRSEQATGGGAAGGGGGASGGGAGGGGAVTQMCGNGTPEGTEECDDMNSTPNDGCEADCTLSLACGNGKREGQETCDDGNTLGGDGCEADCTSFTDTAAVKGCLGLNARLPLIGQTCAVTAGDTGRLVTGVILTDGVTYVGGQVLIDSTGSITCAACDCSGVTGASTATQLVCPQAIVSPGLINAHDHISFQASPQMRTAERYEHRHDWRIPNNGHTRIASGTSNVATQIRWAELRQVMSGTTTVVGATYSSTGNSGLLRNLDSNVAGQLGPLAGQTGVDSDTFPLSDTSGIELTTGCGYPSLPTSAPGTTAYLPHVAEGIEPSARNEFVCLTQNNNGILSNRTALVHGIGLSARDIALVAQTGTSLVWSPRSNISLYGDTAAVPLYHRLGVNIALGTDWTISGSMNLLRELQCADGLNRDYYNNALSDEALWRLVTAGGADATATSASIGRIATGKLGDLAIYKRRPGSFFRSVIDAQPQDVVVTMRGGKVLYGDREVVLAFEATSMCDTFDVCGTQKSACIFSEVPVLAGANAANTYALLQMANTNTYPLFYCDGATPTNEPTCLPERAAVSPRGSNSKLGSTIYTLASTDLDKDGIDDATDNCPMVFNPVRPMDAMIQADADLDGAGDVCDACPLDANTTTCTPFDPNDRDGDGVLNAADNCPNAPNLDQADLDGDSKGDVCDACPNSANPGAAACPSTIYAIKLGQAPTGQAVALNNALVTAVGATGYFLQVAPTDVGYDGGDYSGIFAYAPASGVAVGDRLNIPAATPSNFFGQIQLNGALSASDGGVTIASSANPLPAPQVVNPADVATDGGRAVALEGVLLRVDGVTVTDLAPAPGPADTSPTNEFVVNGSLRVNDYLHLVSPFPTLNQGYVSITGVLDLRNGNSKLEPRFAADIVSGPPTLVSLSPALVFVREDAGITLPTPLLARLSNGAFGDTAITVTASGPQVLVGDGGLIIVPDGGLTAQVPLFGVSSTDGGTVTLTATMGADSRTAAVRVIGENEVPRLVSLTPGTATVTAGGTHTFTVTLDLPSAVPTDVSLSLVPNTVGTVPLTVTVPADALSATFAASIATMAMGTGTLTATLGADMASAVVTVRPANTVDHLVINEVDYDNAGPDSAEFVEIFNGTGAPIDLTGFTLVLINGSTMAGASYATVALGSAGTLSNGEYLVIGSAATVAGLPSGVKAVTMVGTNDLIQNGAPDGLILYDSMGMVVDALSYEGSTHFMGSPVQEGAADTTLLGDTNTAPSPSICRIPNGEDTDVNGTDFKVCAAPTKGTVNAP